MSRYSRENPDEPIRHEWLTGGKRLPEPALPRREVFDSMRWVAEVEAEIRRSKEMRESAESRGEMAYAIHDFGYELGLRFALDAQRRPSATARIRDDAPPTP